MTLPEDRLTVEETGDVFIAHKIRQR